MLPKYHIIFGAIFALSLYLIFPQIGCLGAVTIWISSVLIDADHYLYYIYRKKDFDLKKAFKWFVKLGDKYRSYPKKKQAKFSTPLCILHGFESLILLFILSRFFPLAFFVLIGFIFHLFVDYIFSIYHDVTFHNFSIIYKYIKSRNLLYSVDSK